MDNSEWLQFVSVPSGTATPGPLTDKPLAVSAPTSLPPPVSQVPTPPISQQNSPSELSPESTTIISVSTTFFPAANIGPFPPDLIFLSSDSVFFYVHSHQVLGASENGFQSLLPPKIRKGHEDVGPVIALSEHSAVLNVILHAIYNMTCSHYSPDVDTVTAAVDALHKYGIPVTKYVTPSTPLFQLILALSPLAPIEMYTLAGAYDLHNLAVPISSHLLAFSLPNVTDELAQRMQPIYLKKLFFLHLGRIDALKRLLLPPPQPHAPTPTCDFTEQKSLTRAWALASAYLAWDARPDLSTSSIESALRPLGNHLTCEICQSNLTKRIKQLISQWAVVKFAFISFALVSTLLSRLSHLEHVAP
ncbi:hypothetical protein BXZ70DRAFT_1004294 [Cristinia sonorae]|uniref:BTB domain-containing protein n=1 Tax=Cristinia sonorae TaxID=1940300 RepID=A0A8K0UVX0_9AGAR|nr:hypothetical protein BXZ70DRAFT_1004294 [Cristinia sonorae]